MKLIVIAIGLIILAVSIQTFTQTWDEIGKPVWDDLKSKFKATRLGMWYNNKKNGISIISEKEYNRIIKNNQKIIIL